MNNTRCAFLLNNKCTVTGLHLFRNWTRLHQYRILKIENYSEIKTSAFGTAIVLLSKLQRATILPVRPDMFTEHTGDMLIYEVGKKEFCTSIADINKIVEPDDIFKSAGMSSYKYISMDNCIKRIPLLNIHEMFGEEPQCNFNKRRILVIKGEKEPFGFWVDNIQGIVTINKNPRAYFREFSAGGPGARYLGVIIYGNRFLFLPDLKKLFSSRQSEE